MSTSNTNTEWIPQQIKVFSRWVESHLSEGKANVQVHDVTKDLTNGVALVELAEILTHKNAPNNWAHNPAHIAQMVTNNDTAIDMFTKDGVHFVGISGKDIHDSKEKLVLGLVWTLILHYSIGQSIANDSKYNSSAVFSSSDPAKNNRDALMQWAIDRTESYTHVKDFKPYSMSMCTLLDSYVPDKINYHTLDPNNKKHNAELATRVMKELGIPVFLDSDDLQEATVDEKALLTQLSTAKVVLEKLPPPQPAAHAVETQIHEPVVQSRDINVVDEVSDDDYNADAMKEIEESMRRDQEENKNLPDKIVIDGQEFTNIRVREISLEPQLEEKESESETESDNEIEAAPVNPVNEEEVVETQTREVEKEFVSHIVDGDNSEFAGRKFGLIMSLNETDYNNGEKVDFENDKLPSGEVLQFALTMVKDKQSFINPAGLKLTIADSNIENDVFQQFTFGEGDWNTVIDSVEQRGMVWDVADELNNDPPAGTPFYLFPFHGRHNQHFIYKDEMIYAKQNGQVVTYVGGEVPLVMMPPSHKLRARQTFALQFI